MKVKLLIMFFLLSAWLYCQERVDETTLLINSGQTKSSVGTQSVTDTIDVIGPTDYLVVVLVLILVIGALYLVLKFIRKVGGSRIGIDNDLIHVISTRALKGTTALHLVEVGNQIFLIGATDSSINTISEITDKESKDMIALNLSVDNLENRSFIQYFTDKLKKNNITNDGNQKEEATPDINTQRDKLDRF